YRAAAASDGGRWVEPFLFATNHQPGFMYVARDAPRGTLRGVWAVEYEVSYLSEFLASLHVGKSGRVYVVSRSGLVVGHPARQVTETSVGKVAIAHAARHPDPMLAAAWDELSRRGAGPQSFLVGPWLAMAEPFPVETGIDW